MTWAPKTTIFPDPKNDEQKGGNNKRVELYIMKLSIYIVRTTLKPKIDVLLLNESIKNMDIKLDFKDPGG